MRIVESSTCSGPGCSQQRLGGTLWCRACSRVSEAVRQRFRAAALALGRHRAVPDAVWDEYLDARAVFFRAKDEYLDARAVFFRAKEDRT